MKKILILGFTASFLVTALSSASLAIAKDEKAKPPTKEEKAAAKAKADAALARKEAEVKARSKLSAKEWTVQLTSSSGKKAKSENDTLTFSEGKVTSKNLTDKGYPTSNYSITLGNDDMIIWETMQTSENQDVAFWRGELQGEVMTGVLSLHPVKGEAQDFYFTSKGVEQAVQPEATEEAKPQPQKKEAETSKKKTKSNKK